MRFARFAAQALTALAIVSGTELAVAQNSRTADLDRQLLNAIVKGNLASTRILLDQGANIEAKDESGSTPLVLAAESNNVAMVKLLLEKGADAGAKDRQDETVLMHTATRASWSGGTEVLGMLLERTSDASEKEKALFAVLREGGSIVIRGVSENANSEAAANETGKPQSEPPDTPAVRTVRLLLDKGVPIESRDEEGSTLLTTAAGYGETEIVRLLLERGADVQAKDEHGLTALMAAACQCALATMNDTYDIVKILLEKGADVNGRNHEGETALILASGMAGDPAVLKLLLDGGADPTAKDKHGDTALALAIKSYRPDKVQVLKQATAHAR